jgi:hypothetical protein
MSKSIWAHEPILTPERRVWRAVLSQAVEDAEITPVDDENEVEPSTSLLARRYLRADDLEEAEHLNLVCDFADVPADRMILWARRRYSVERMIEKHLESGSADAAFLADESDSSEKGEPFAQDKLSSHTPQSADSQQVPTST